MAIQMDGQKERYKSCIERLCLMDDTFFNVCMDGYLAGMACILRIMSEQSKKRAKVLVIDHISSMSTAQYRMRRRWAG